MSQRNEALLIIKYNKVQHGGNHSDYAQNKYNLEEPNSKILKLHCKLNGALRYISKSIKNHLLQTRQQKEREIKERKKISWTMAKFIKILINA